MIDQFTAVNIYFMLGPDQVYNISDHCFVAIQFVGLNYLRAIVRDFGISQGCVCTIDSPPFVSAG